MTDSPSKRRRKGFRLRTRLLVAVLLSLCVGLGLLYLAIEDSPAWYRPVDAAGKHVIALGHETQNRIISQLHDVRPGDPEWTIDLTNDEMNAWLAVNLSGWLEMKTGQSWPDQASLPVVSVDEDGVNIGIRFEDKFSGRVVSARLLPQIISQDDPDASHLKIAVDSVSIGRLPLPAGLIGQLITELAEATGQDLGDGDFERVIGMVLGEMTFDPVMRLSDGRRVRMLGFDLGEDGASVTFRTLAKRKKNKRRESDSGEN